jgi:hypothetical protein
MYPTPRRLNTQTARFIGEESNLMTQTDLRAGSKVRFAGGGYNEEAWNDKLAKELNITKYGFNDYLNKAKFDQMILKADTKEALDWKKDLRHLFE